MMHLSLLRLPRRSPRWQFLQAYQLHQLLWSAFPGIPRHSSENRFLYRHDELEREHSVLVQSAVRPDWSALDHEGEGTTAQVREIAPETLATGSELRFFLRANPVVCRIYPEESSGSAAEKKSRHILVGSDRKRMAERLGVDIGTLPSREQQLIDWLTRKGVSGGFSLVATLPGPSRDFLIRKPKDAATGKNGVLTFTGVDFEGILQVTDPSLFATTVGSGIGRGKAFGFGLLSLRN